MSTESWSKSSRLPVYHSAKQVPNGAAESSHDGEGGQSGGVVLWLTHVEEVRAARRLTGVAAAVEKDDTEDRQRDAVRRQAAPFPLYFRLILDLIVGPVRPRRRRRRPSQPPAMPSELAQSSPAAALRTRLVASCLLYCLIVFGFRIRGRRIRHLT